MKKLLHFFIAILFLVSCKPASPIVTSKIEAEKQGIYKLPVSKKIAIKKNTSAKIVEAKKITPKKEINIKKTEEKTPSFDYIVENQNPDILVEKLVNSAFGNLGVNYRSGGTTRAGFDCSGLMYATFKNFDIILPRSSNEMAEVGKKLNSKEIKRGDLIFFKTNGKHVINHVGMVLEVADDEIKFIHSATHSGVIISSTKEPYYHKSFAQVNRIL